jgi:hypothetical protein
MAHQVLDSKELEMIQELAEREKYLNNRSLCTDKVGQPLEAIWKLEKDKKYFTQNQLGHCFLDRPLVKNLLELFIDKPEEIYRDIIENALAYIEDPDRNASH